MRFAEVAMYYSYNLTTTFTTLHSHMGKAHKYLSNLIMTRNEENWVIFPHSSSSHFSEVERFALLWRGLEQSGNIANRRSFFKSG